MEQIPFLSLTDNGRSTRSLSLSEVERRGILSSSIEKHAQDGYEMSSKEYKSIQVLREVTRKDILLDLLLAKERVSWVKW